jgi:MoxR-like ATPase
MPNNVAPGRDASRHVAAPYDPLRHTLTVRDVEAQLLAAGVPRSRRQIQRLCDNQSFDATPLGPNDEWYISPDSVPKVIGDLRALDEARARRVATQRDVTQPVAPSEQPISNNDMARHDAPRRDMSGSENKEKKTTTPTDTSRHAPAKRYFRARTYP